MLNFIASWRREREVVRELSRLSDRGLADLGITRSDIRAVVGRAAKRTAVAPQPVGGMAPSWGVHLRGSVAA